MIKVHILDRCESCDGEAYIFDCQDVDSQGQTFDRYRPCSGQAPRPDVSHGMKFRSGFAQDRILHPPLLEETLTPILPHFVSRKDAPQRVRGKLGINWGQASPTSGRGDLRTKGRKY